jgi:hypothetical protein
MKHNLPPYQCPTCGGLEVDKELGSAGDQYRFIPEDGEFYWQRTDSSNYGESRVTCITCGEDVTSLFRTYEEAGLVN